MAMIYCADIYCDDCAAGIPLDGLTDTGDSDDYPQYAGDDGGEADCPQACGKCLAPLDNPLTADGVKYVLEAIRDSLRDGKAARGTIHDCYKGTYWEGSRHCEIVRSWAEQIAQYSLSDRNERLVERYLDWTAD